MERAALLRSITCSTVACNRFLFRSSHRLSRSSVPFSSSLSLSHHRSVGTLTRRSSVLRRHWRLLPSSSSIPSTRCFSLLSPKAIATSPEQASPDVFGSQDDLAEKYGFEKVSEQFIQECISKAVLYKHKKTGAEVMSVSNDDENKVFGIVFRTPPCNCNVFGENASLIIDRRWNHVGAEKPLHPPICVCSEKWWKIVSYFSCF